MTGPRPDCDTVVDRVATGRRRAGDARRACGESVRILCVLAGTPPEMPCLPPPRTGGSPLWEMVCVSAVPQVRERLAAESFDAVLVSISGKRRRDVSLARLQEAAPDLPLVLLADGGDESLALRAIRAGAQDFLVRAETGPAALMRSIRFAIERNRTHLELRARSMVDDLTGLHNRRGLLTAAQQRLRAAERHGTQGVVLFIDLDDLKEINDRFGHPVGDAALVDVAGILRGAFRETDVLGRLGGDEFVVVAPDASARAAELLVRRLRESLAAFNRSGARAFPLSFSVGMAHYDGGAPLPLDELIARADALMYAEKRRKRAPRLAAAAAAASPALPPGSAAR